MLKKGLSRLLLYSTFAPFTVTVSLSEPAHRQICLSKELKSKFQVAPAWRPFGRHKVGQIPTEQLEQDWPLRAFRRLLWPMNMASPPDSPQLYPVLSEMDEIHLTLMAKHQNITPACFEAK